MGRNCERDRSTMCDGFFEKLKVKLVLGLPAGLPAVKISLKAVMK